MRLRTIAGVAAGGVAAAAIAGGVAFAADDQSGDGSREPVMRIVQDSQPGGEKDCPEEATPPTTSETGL